jgi:hypothetical protein
MAKLSVTLERDTFDAIEVALRLADELCTSVISGQSGQQRSALAVVRALTDLKRANVFASGK